MLKERKKEKRQGEREEVETTTCLENSPQWRWNVTRFLRKIHTLLTLLLSSSSRTFFSSFFYFLRLLSTQHSFFSSSLYNPTKVLQKRENYFSLFLGLFQSESCSTLSAKSCFVKMKHVERTHSRDPIKQGGWCRFLLSSFEYTYFSPLPPFIIHFFLSDPFLFYSMKVFFYYPKETSSIRSH